MKRSGKIGQVKDISAPPNQENCNVEEENRRAQSAYQRPTCIIYSREQTLENAHVLQNGHDYRRGGKLDDGLPKRKGFPCVCVCMYIYIYMYLCMK
jgi:hypothetical protein